MALIRLVHLDEMVAKYKTVPAKKTFLTKEINALTEHCKEIRSAYERRGKDSNYGWYLGDKIYLRDVKNAEANIKIVTRYKAENFA
jgi:hypothetical protein